MALRTETVFRTIDISSGEAVLVCPENRRRIGFNATVFNAPFAVDFSLSQSDGENFHFTSSELSMSAGGFVPFQNEIWCLPPLALVGAQLHVIEVIERG